LSVIAIEELQARFERVNAQTESRKITAWGIVGNYNGLRLRMELVERIEGTISKISCHKSLVIYERFASERVIRALF
jgi:hypothetical protein